MAKPAVQVKTGFADLDEAIIAFQPGCLYILVADPFCGKTAFCLNIAINNTKGAYPSPILYINPTVATQQLAQRVLASSTGIAYRKILESNMNEADWSQVTDNIDALIDIEQRIVHIDSTGTSIGALKACVSEMPVKPKLLILDDVDRYHPDLQLPIHSLMNLGDLKQLSIELHVPIFLACSIDRDKETSQIDTFKKTESKYPGLVDADCVMLLCESVSNNVNSFYTGIKNVTIDVYTNKLGPEASAGFIFNLEKQVFISDTAESI
jgi:replicative DNA helicase